MTRPTRATDKVIAGNDEPASDDPVARATGQEPGSVPKAAKPAKAASSRKPRPAKKKGAPARGDGPTGSSPGVTPSEEPSPSVSAVDLVDVDRDRKTKVNEIISRAMARRSAGMASPRRADPSTPPAPVGMVPLDDGGPAPSPEPGSAPAGRPTSAAGGPTAPPAPKGRGVILVGSNRHETRYLRRPGIELDLVATAPCAVEVRADGADGALLYDDTLHDGGTVELPSRGTFWLRLEDPHAIRIEADGEDIRFASPPGPTPYSLLFATAQP